MSARRERGDESAVWYRMRRGGEDTVKKADRR
jgi:hypothetical protein